MADMIYFWIPACPLTKATPVSPVVRTSWLDHRWHVPTVVSDRLFILNNLKKGWACYPLMVECICWLPYCMCVSGHKGFFLHKDSKTSHPEGVHSQLYSRWQRWWKPCWKQLHVGCKSVTFVFTTVCYMNFIALLEYNILSSLPNQQLIFLKLLLFRFFGYLCKSNRFHHICDIKFKDGLHFSIIDRIFSMRARSFVFRLLRSNFI